MRLLADENFPAEAGGALREGGHDVLWIRQAHPGMADITILALAIAESRTVLTFDKDFGELAFKSRLPASCGIVLFRIRKQSPERIAARTMEVIGGRTDWSGHFSVVEEDRVRMTLLPQI